MRKLTVWIAAAARKRMIKEAARTAPNETGGVIMGYTGDNEDTIVVTHIIGPGPAATHRRAMFAPDLQYQERAISRRYRESRRRITYLGDWHSHPGGSDRLSNADRKTLRRIRDHADARAPEPLMAIMHGPDPITLTVWRLQRRRGYGSRLRRANVNVFDS